MEQIIKKKLARNWFKTLQEVLCKEIEELEGRSNLFRYKNWERGKKSSEGGGQSRLYENGKIFDKVGVNFSEVYGKFSKQFRNKIPGTSKNSKFWASGISVVMHMKNPHVPAMHFNTRYIYTSHGWCDEYFYLPHRNEPRGIGGIFFDYKKDNWEKDFSFVREVGISFTNIFREIILKQHKKKWTKKEKEIQYEKRGRYVEFNLLYDRGTKFGLQTGGNVDAILMSLPPIAKWK